MVEVTELRADDDESKQGASHNMSDALIITRSKDENDNNDERNRNHNVNPPQAQMMTDTGSHRLPPPSFMLDAYNAWMMTPNDDSGGIHSRNSNTNTTGTTHAHTQGTPRALLSSPSWSFENAEDLMSQSLYSLIDILTDDFLESRSRMTEETPSYDMQISNIFLPCLCFHQALHYFNDYYSHDCDEREEGAEHEHQHEHQPPQRPSLYSSYPAMASAASAPEGATQSLFVSEQAHAAVRLWQSIMAGSKSKSGSTSGPKTEDNVNEQHVLAPHELIRISLECRSIISSAVNSNSEEVAMNMWNNNNEDNGNGKIERQHRENSANPRGKIEEAFATMVALQVQRTALKVVLGNVLSTTDNNRVTVQPEQGPVITGTHKNATDNKKTANRTGTKPIIRWRRISSMVEQFLETIQKGMVQSLDEFCQGATAQFRHEQAMSLANDDDTSESDDDSDQKNGDAGTLAGSSPKQKYQQRSSLKQQCQFIYDVTHVIATTMLEPPLQLARCVDEHYSNGPAQLKRTSDTQQTGSRIIIKKQRKLVQECIAFVGLMTNLVDVVDQTRTLELDCCGGENYTKGKIEVGASSCASLLHNMTSLIFSRIPYVMPHEILMHPVRVEYMRNQEERAERRMKRKNKNSTKRTTGTGTTEDEENYTLFHNRMERFRTDPSRLFTERSAIEWNLRGLAIAAHFLLVHDSNNSTTSSLSTQQSLLSHWHVYSPTMKWCLMWPHLSTLLLKEMPKKSFEMMKGLTTAVPPQVLLGCWNYNNNEGDTIKRSQGPYPYFSKPSTDGVMGLVGPMQLWFNVISRNSSPTSSHNNSSAATSQSSHLPSNGEIIQMLKSCLRRVRDPSLQVECVKVLIERSPYPRLVPLLLDILRIPIMMAPTNDDTVAGSKNSAYPYRNAILHLLQPYVEEMESYCNDRSDELSARARQNQLAALMDSYEIYQATIALLTFMTRREWLVSRDSKEEDNNCGLSSVAKNKESSPILLRKAVSTAEQLGRKVSFQMQKSLEQHDLATENTTSDKDTPMALMAPSITLQEQVFRLNLLIDSVEVLRDLSR
jgi:hypothetical protein